MSSNQKTVLYRPAAAATAVLEDRDGPTGDEDTEDNTNEENKITTVMFMSSLLYNLS